MEKKRVYVLMYNDGKETEVEGVYLSKEGMIAGFKELLAIDMNISIDELPTGLVYTRCKYYENPKTLLTLEKFIDIFLEEEVYTTLGGRTISYDKYSTIKP